MTKRVPGAERPWFCGFLPWVLIYPRILACILLQWQPCLAINNVSRCQPHGWDWRLNRSCDLPWSSFVHQAICMCKISLPVSYGSVARQRTVKNPDHYSLRDHNRQVNVITVRWSYLTGKNRSCILLLEVHVLKRLTQTLAVPATSPLEVAATFESRRLCSRGMLGYVLDTFNPNSYFAGLVVCWDSFHSFMIL